MAEILFACVVSTMRPNYSRQREGWRVDFRKVDYLTEGVKNLNNSFINCAVN